MSHKRRINNTVRIQLTKTACPFPLEGFSTDTDSSCTKHVGTPSKETLYAVLSCREAMPSPVNAELRKQVINIYKELLNLGKNYPQGHEYFRRRLHTAFSANSALRDDDAIRRAIARAQFVQKEIEALYYLKRYRTLRQRYDGE